MDGIARVYPEKTRGRVKHSEGDVVGMGMHHNVQCVHLPTQVMWSACLDNADSHEVVTDDGRYKGAMSYAFAECLRGQVLCTPDDFLRILSRISSRSKLPGPSPRHRVRIS